MSADTSSTSNPAFSNTIQLSNTKELPLVSIIIPSYNCKLFLSDAFESILLQTYKNVEVSIFDDGSMDGSIEYIETWRNKFRDNNIKFIFTAKSNENNNSNVPITRDNNDSDDEKDEEDEMNFNYGAAYARNRAVLQCAGEYLCFLDADDIMLKDRIKLQLEFNIDHPDYLIGSKFIRIPENSTPRYTNWLNNMTDEELYTHRFKENTIIQPTFFLSKAQFNKIGGYKFGKAEDLKFFYRHIELGGKIHRINEPLLIYRYRDDSVTSLTSEKLIRSIRVSAIEQQLINGWDKFVIWNAGKDGRAFYRNLTAENKAKVAYFTDIDPKIIGTTYDDHGQGSEGPKRKLVRKIPIHHFMKLKEDKDMKYITCVSWDKTNGKFQENIHLVDGKIGVNFYPFG